jgi:protein PhnA
MEYPNCPKCKGVNTYLYDSNFVCPDCFHEWREEEITVEEQAEESLVVKDVNGVVLSNGDSVVTIKTLPVKGTSQSIKAGTKVRNIKLVEGDHNIDCKIDGFGAMALKSEFVKKA